MAVPDDVIAGSISEESTKVHVEAADVSDSKDAKSPLQEGDTTARQPAQEDTSAPPLSEAEAREQHSGHRSRCLGPSSGIGVFPRRSGQASRLSDISVMQSGSRGNDDGSSSECGGLGLTASESPEESRSSSLLSSPITSESNSHEEADVVGKNPTVANVTVSSSPRDYAQRGGRGMGLLSATGIMRNYPTTAPPIVKIIKVVILGDAAVGKTSLIQRYMHGSFSHHSYKPTVGADFYSKKLDIIPDQVAGCRCAVNMQIWDTAGQERFRSLGASFYRGADACILVCDVSRQNGLRNVLDWRRDFLKHADPDEPEKFPFVFVANKTDLPEHAFTESDMIELITGMKEEHLSCPDYPVVMASAENGTGVSQVFELAGAAAVQRANENDRRFSPQGLPGDSDSAGAIMLATGMHSVARQGTCAGC